MPVQQTSLPSKLLTNRRVWWQPFGRDKLGVWFRVDHKNWQAWLQVWVEQD